MYQYRLKTNQPCRGKIDVTPNNEKRNRSDEHNIHTLPFAATRGETDFGRSTGADQIGP